MTRIAPSPPSPRSSGPANAQQPGDARAMQDALASARGRMPPMGYGPTPRDRAAAGLAGRADAENGSLGQRGALSARLEMPAAEQPAADAMTVPLDAAPEALVRRRAQREQVETGLAMAGQSGGPVLTTMPAMPSPQADPSAFAQLMADIWTRENGRGTKEILVRFGDRAWPATGARLIRNAAGALDITVLMDAPSVHDLRPLETALGSAGVPLGALTTEPA